MSSALALVTPRAVVNPDAPNDAALPAAVEEPLLVVAKVPDLRPATASSSSDAPTPAPKSSWRPSWLPRPKFRVAYLKVAATLAGLDFATCWAWIITLPPIVKLGTIAASVVMSIWMFTTGNNDQEVEPAPSSSWKQEDVSPRVQAAAEPSPRSQPDALQTPSDDAPRVARDAAHGDGPTIREIQAAARGRTADAGQDDSWPRVAERDGAVASATVRPIAPHKEPYDAAPRGAAIEPLPVDATPADGAPQPPTDMPRRWAERPQPTDTAGYPPVQTNPHYADTVIAETPSRALDNRTLDNRAMDNRTADNRALDARHFDRDRTYGDDRSADPRVADRFAVQPTPEQLEAERRAYENNRRRAYELSRDRAQAERQSLPESFRR